MKDSIEYRWKFNRSPKEIWEYLTDSELLEQWLGKMDFRPIVGHKFEVPTKTGATTKCEVTEVIPYKRLAWSWKYISAKNSNVVDSIVVFNLSPTHDGTELHLIHNGFNATEDLNNHNNGWTLLGSRLAKLLNTHP